MSVLWSWSGSTSTSYDGTAGTAPSIISGGTWGERFVWASATTQQYLYKAVTVPGDFGVRVIYTVASFPTSSFSVMQASSGGTSFGTSTSTLRVDLTSGGLVRIRDNAGATTTGTVALDASEYRFEMFRVGTTMTAKVYRVSDNVLMDTVTRTVLNTALTYVAIGNVATLTGTIGSTTADEIVIQDVGAEVGDPARALAATAAVSPTSGVPPFTLTLTITAVGGTGSYTYAVTNWGDGTTSASQSSNVFTKSIASGAATGTKTINWSVTG